MKATTTALEDFITALYQELTIHDPEQLCIRTIAGKLDIVLHEHEGSPFALKGRHKQIIFLPQNAPYAEKWEAFAHELGHLLLHSGNQLYLPPSFVKLQEEKGMQFALHFCVPTFMLEREPFLHRRADSIQRIMKQFRVTESFATLRYEHWYRQQEAVYLQYKIKEALTWPSIDLSKLP